MHFPKKICFLILLFLISVNTSDLHKCQSDSDCQFYFHCTDGYCIHKTLFPIKFLEYITLVVMAGVSLFATAAGIGGGPIYSTGLMFISNFVASDAFPISNFVIFCCSTATFIFGLKSKIENPEEEFVDFEIALILCPLLLFGTKIGVILNKILPSIVLSVFLILFLIFSIGRIRKQAIKAADDEEKEIEHEKLLNEEKIESERMKEIIFQNQIQYGSSMPTPFIPLKERRDSKIELRNLNNDFEGRKIQLIDNKKLKLLVFFYFAVILDQFIEGNEKVVSLIGIKRCSFTYWIAFILFGVFCVYSSIHLKALFFDEKKINNLFYQQFNQNIIKTIAGGFIAGLVGVGGGIVVTPMLLEAGLKPKETASTSNFLLVFTALVGTTLFIFQGSLRMDYAIFYAFFCSIATVIGNQFIKDYIKRTKKSSLIVFLVLYILIASVAVLPINGIVHLISDIRSHASILELKNNCPK